MKINNYQSEYKVLRDMDRCIDCGLCIKECSNLVHQRDKKGKLFTVDKNCVNCHRCVATCPVDALKIIKNDYCFRDNCSWSKDDIVNIYRQADTGGVLLASMGTAKEYPIYWDKLFINASQVTNPSIDPLREPMETRTFLGKRNTKIEYKKNGDIVIQEKPFIELSTPIMFSAMSYGSISLNAHKALAGAAKELDILYNCGEGGLHKSLFPYGPNTIIQVASGRFGVNSDYLKTGAAIEIKIGQGAKPGIGGHLTGAKINKDISKTRMIPEGFDAISPAPHHDIYSIEDLRQLVDMLKEATDYKKPVIVKVAAVHNISSIVSGIARSGADIIAIDGFRGGTGAAPLRIRDNVGIPIEFALAACDERLREEGIRDTVSLVIGGSIRHSADIVKAIALGADAVYIGTAALIALGCRMCRTCSKGNCNWGIATQREELVKRLNVEEGKERLVNLISAWTVEIKEMMGGMGINSIEALRGNRLMLRGIDLHDRELKVLGIKNAGE